MSSDYKFKDFKYFILQGDTDMLTLTPWIKELVDRILKELLNIKG